MSDPAPPVLDVIDARLRDGHVYDIPHPTGAPCAVRDLLCHAYGVELGEWLLWNRTCFPMDDETAWEQAKEIVRTGTWASEEEVEAEMRRPAERA